MKKKLVVLLAVVMMFAFSASAYAASFSDVSERPVVEQDAIKKAVALGIIEGYEDGTFGPDKTITRAEFAKIAVTAAGAKDTATMLEANASSFKDVRANSWYTGWINAAESLGIFKGDQNGNFRPNDTISNQEAITVLLRLLGYNDNLTGSWPVNYVTKANQIGILDDVSIVASAAAKRGDIVVMLSETLDTYIVTYDKDTNEFVYKQTTKSGSSYITLLADSFEGNYLDVQNFDRVDQVRDVAAKTLNWSVGDVVTEKIINNSTNNNTVVSQTASYGGNLIIDENTAVSYNAEGLFDLENHKGKVYFVKENGKLYARFIEVESYVQKVSDAPKQTSATDRKVTVGTTNYNAAPTTTDNNGNIITGVYFTGDRAAVGTTGYAYSDGTRSTKNSSYYMYFNDDDQVYRVVSDRDFSETAWYVKSVSTNSARLVGSDGPKTKNMSDADTLIWDGNKFLSPSDLESGDAIMEIKEGELYVKIADKNGDFTRVSMTSSKAPYQYKAMIGGTNYVYKNLDSESNDFLEPNFYDEDLEDSDVVADDVFNNNVRFIQNKNNVVAAIIVDETSGGSTLYGIMMDGDQGGSIANRTNSITLFTQEGYTVTYDYAKTVTTDNDEDNSNFLSSGNHLNGYAIGQLVEYKLNANGEIKKISLIAYDAEYNNESNVNGFADGQKQVNATAKDFADEIEVENNAYLTYNGANPQTLASNVVIFEVSSDDGDVDPSLVTRSSLLGGGNFTPEASTFKDIKLPGYNTDVNFSISYASFKKNNNGAIKVLAYTNAEGSKYNYGVVKAYDFRDYDTSHAITFVGDDTVYDLNKANWTENGTLKAGNDQLVVYKMTGDEVTIVYAFGNDAKMQKSVKRVTGFNDGLITIGSGAVDKTNGWLAGVNDPKNNKVTNTPYAINMDVDGVKYVIEDKGRGDQPAAGPFTTFMTDSSTVVYIINASTGDYEEGSVSDISRNAWVYIPVVDKDGYADLVIIDEYPRPNDMQ